MEIARISGNDTRDEAVFACETSDNIDQTWHFLRSTYRIEQFSAMPLDRYDKLILEELQKDGRIGNVQLANAVSLSESARARRVRSLEESGMTDRYAALINQQKAGLPGNVFVHIGLQREEERELAAFEEAVKNIPEVMECYLTTGKFDYL